MRNVRLLLAGVATATLAGLPVVVGASGSAGATTGFTRQIGAGGSTSLFANAPGGDGIQQPEIFGGGGEAGTAPQTGPVVDRSDSSGPAHGPSVTETHAKSSPSVVTSFNGLNFRQQRLANGGNQFSVEPPDQGMCAGNGYVLESVNDVIRVFDTAGNPLTGVVDLNSFYGYPAAFNRTTFVQGPFVTDPSCLFDGATQRWINVVLTLDIDGSTGDFTGPNHLDVAVSKTPDPTGAWTIYRIPVQNDGTDGTPDHNCSFGPCIGDYPHIGADANGFYITTNEYSLFGPEYKWAIVYAISKAALASNAASIAVTELDTPTSAGGNPGFTLWPAQSAAGQYVTGNGGTEYFLSSDAAEEAGNETGTSTRIWQWSLTNTSSLATSSPSLSLTPQAIPVGLYAIPPKADQKSGDAPLRECLNDTRCAKQIILGTRDPYAPEPLSPLDANDTRMQQVWYANGRLWGALDTAVTINGEQKAGIEWFIVAPSSATIVMQGYLAVADNNVIYPAIAVTGSGRGVMAFTLVGADHYPSAAFASIDALSGVGAVQVAAEGAGPQDGFTGYAAFVGFPPRPRWGDYGAAALDGNRIWLASEYIAQTCTLSEYLTAPIGSCGGTRAALGNWATRITAVAP